jgi:hypothetical protein
VLTSDDHRRLLNAAVHLYNTFIHARRRSACTDTFIPSERKNAPQKHFKNLSRPLDFAIEMCYIDSENRGTYCSLRIDIEPFKK